MSFAKWKKKCHSASNRRSRKYGSVSAPSFPDCSAAAEPISFCPTRTICWKPASTLWRSLPGKNCRIFNCCPGGERALTAIALLFAILHVKPVPFCVLDEVEAALDDANVTRFAEYLREFSRTTQFIVVTHRKGTMEEADVLYGVTMEEDGVSKLVSVRLEDGEAVSA